MIISIKTMQRQVIVKLRRGIDVRITLNQENALSWSNTYSKLLLNLRQYRVHNLPFIIIFVM